METRVWLRTAIAFVFTVAYGCGSNDPEEPDVHKSTLTDLVTVMKLESSEFEDGKKLDARYTVEGQDISPPLSWPNAPTGTKSFALICDDPDAPSPQNPAAEPWVHWIIFNIPAEHSDLPKEIGNELEPDECPGAKQGLNSWPSDNVGYRGPAPPPGSGQHRYFFKIYALDTMLELDAGAEKGQLVEAMSKHILAEGQLVGLYER